LFEHSSEQKLFVPAGAMPLATLKLVDETSGRNQAKESWRHVLIREVSPKGA